MKLDKSTFLKAIDIKCWKIKLLNIKHRRVVKKYLAVLLDYHNNKTGYDFNGIRDKLLVNILEYAKTNCKYYNKILSNINVKDTSMFHQIPFLTKDIIRTEPLDIISNSVSFKSMGVTKTGGSTGEPLSYWSSTNTDDLHQQFLIDLFGYRKGDKILAMDGTFIEKELVDKKIFWKEKCKGNQIAYGGMALSSLYFSEENKSFYYEFIKDYRPDFIRGYPAFVSDLAQYIIENDKSIDFKMKGIELTSELVFDHQITIIKRAFKTNVLGQYGHAEACVFGYTVDDSFEYYCSPVYGLTEVLDTNGKHVMVDEEGEIVVTRFSNFGMPFIRYKPGDRAIYGGEVNGLVKLKKVLGRTADYIINRKGEKLLVTGLIFGQHFQAFANISQWQIIQDIPGEITINTVQLPGYSIKDETEISDIFKNIGGIDSKFVYNQDFVKTRAGKTRFIVQNVKLNNYV